MIYTLGGHRIETSGDDFYVAPGAHVIGRVRLGRGAGVWFNCVVRRDDDHIIVGHGSNIEDGTIVHVYPGIPAEIGRNVSVGHSALLPGCTVDDGTSLATVPLCSTVRGSGVIV
jgi:carbonic anhydrase/acetyltransferase-like protein (isoleucine patch superfamily)